VEFMSVIHDELTCNASESVKKTAESGLYTLSIKALSHLSLQYDDQNIIHLLPEVIMAANSNTYHSSNVNAPRVHRALPVAPSPNGSLDLTASTMQATSPSRWLQTKFPQDNSSGTSVLPNVTQSNMLMAELNNSAANLPYHHEGDRTTRGNAFCE